MASLVIQTTPFSGGKISADNCPSITAIFVYTPDKFAALSFNGLMAILPRHKIWYLYNAEFTVTCLRAHPENTPIHDATIEHTIFECLMHIAHHSFFPGIYKYPSLLETYANIASTRTEMAISKIPPPYHTLAKVHFIQRALFPV